MSSQVRILLLAVIVGVVVVRWTGQSNATPNGPRQENPRQEKRTTGDSVARYATDGFFAACCVRPRHLIEHAYFGSLPIGTFLPAPLLLGRLDAMDVEELVVFCAPATDGKPDDGRATGIEWAAGARTSHPIELEAAITQWRQSLVPQETASDAQPVAVQIEKHQCFRVPAGTFFTPSRTSHQLRFTDRNGAPKEKGINVGYIYEYRGYVEGATKSSAIFTLDHLDEADLVDSHLPLELRPDVFLTHFLDHEYSVATIELRNPDSGLRSEPISFEAKSHVNHHLKVPRKITAVQSEGRRQVDLLKDLVSKGRLEVILKATESGVYLGVGRLDLNLRPRAFEYVHASGHEIVVAQSPKTLKKMLSAAAKPVLIAERLSESSGDIVITASVRGEPQRTTFRRLMQTIGDHPVAKLLGDELTDITATVSVNEPTVAQVTAKFVGRGNASRAARQFQQVIRAAKDKSHASIEDSLNRLDAMGSLSSLVFDGISFNFPNRQSPNAKARASQLLSIIDDSLDSIQVESEDNVVTVEFTRPASLSRLPEAAQIAVANMEEILARDLISRERFDLGDEMYQRVTDRFPHAPQAWFRRAHQLAYNTSVQFDGYANRYAWVRRGVDVLLDGAEQNPDSTDLTWMAARFIAQKIGDVDERVAYRQLFAEDEHLHKRISKIINLEQTRSPDKKVDNWLVAKLLVEHCLDRYAKSQGTSSIPALLLFSRPAATQARYAQALSESGHWDEALHAWKEAERLHNELGERTILVGTDRIRLNDLEARLAKFGPNDASVKQLQAARRQIQFDYWLTRCRLEQTAKVQLARKLSHEAAQHALRSEPELAYDLYRKSLQTLSELRPTEMLLLAGEFKHAAAGYRKVAKTLTEADKESLESILALIEQSQPVSMFPLVNLQNAGEGDSSFPK